MKEPKGLLEIIEQDFTFIGMGKLGNDRPEEFPYYNCNHCHTTITAYTLRDHY